MFFYVEGDDSDCIDCRLLYPKFITAAQTFEDNNDIIFGRVSDKVLVDMFEVDSFPEIVYYEFGSAIPRRYRGDITANAVEELVVEVMPGNFDKLKRHYSVEITVSNFQEILNNSHQYRLVMLHKHDDEEDIESFEELAKTYDNEQDLVIARIDVDQQKHLRREFGSLDYPSFYWYQKGEVKKRKRYGGEMVLNQMIQFVNKQTGFQRLSGGALGHKAGLIKQMDEIIKLHIKDIYEIKYLDTIISLMNKALIKIDERDRELAQYYIHCVQEINEDKTVDSLGEERNRLFRRMDEDNVGPVKRDVLWKKTNIINKIIDLLGLHLMGKMDINDENILKSFNLVDGDDNDMESNEIIFHEEL